MINTSNLLSIQLMFTSLPTTKRSHFYIILKFKRTQGCSIDYAQQYDTRSTVQM